MNARRNITIQSALTPSFYFSKCLGLFPTLKNLKNMGRSKYGYIYCFSLYSLLFVTFWYTIIPTSIYTLDSVKIPPVDEYVFIFHTWFQIFIVSLIIVSSFVCEMKIKDLISYFNHIGDKFRSISIQIPYNLLYFVSLAMTFHGIFGIGCTAILFIYLRFPNTNNAMTVFSYLCKNIYFLISKLILYQSLNQLMLAVLLIRNCFIIINKDLKSLLERENFIYLEKPQAKTYLDGIQYSRRWFLSSGKPIDGSSESLLHRIRVLQQIHFSLCDITRSVNSVFSVPGLLNIATMFSDVLIKVYTSLVSSVRNTRSHTYIWTMTYWTTLEIARILILAIICTRTVEEVSKFSNMSYKIMHINVGINCTIY